MNEKWLSYACKHEIFVRNQWTVKLMMTSLNRVRVFTYIINPTKLYEDMIKHDRVIMFTSLKCGIFVCNQWTLMVVMTSLNWVRLYLCIINPTKFGENRMKNAWVIIFTSFLITDRQTLWLQYPSVPRGKNYVDVYKHWSKGVFFIGSSVWFKLLLLFFM